MDKITEAFEALPKEVTAAVEKLTPEALKDMIGGLVDPERAQAYLKAEAEKLKKAAKEAAETTAATKENLHPKEILSTDAQPRDPDQSDAAAENRELVAKCAAMMAMMTKAAAEKEAPRSWTTKAYEYQHAFNTSVKALIQAKDFEKAVTKIDARNADLMLADKQPGILATLDTAKSYAQGSGESMSSALLAAIIANPGKGRLGGGTGSKPRGGYKRFSQQPSSSSAPPAKVFRCFKCGRNGHYASSCHAKPT